MVLFERAIIELSSVVASVTLLQRHQYGSAGEWREALHQRIWLLLFLENGC